MATLATVFVLVVVMASSFSQLLDLCRRRRLEADLLLRSVLLGSFFSLSRSDSTTVVSERADDLLRFNLAAVLCDGGGGDWSESSGIWLRFDFFLSCRLSHSPWSSLVVPR